MIETLKHKSKDPSVNLLLRLNAKPKTGGDAPWPPWSLSIQTHKVLGLK